MADTKHITKNLAHQFGEALWVLASNHLLRSLALKTRKTIQTLRNAWTKQIFCLPTLPCVIKTRSSKFTHWKWMCFLLWYSRTMCSKFLLLFQSKPCPYASNSKHPKVEKYPHCSYSNTSSGLFFFFFEAMLKFLLSPSCSNAYHTRHLQM